MRGLWVRRRVVITWIASYALISVIPLAGALIAHRLSVDVIRRETNAAHRYMLLSLRRQCDAVLQDVVRVFNDVAVSSAVSAALDGRATTAKAYDLVLLVREIRASLVVGNSRIDEVLVRREGSPLVVSSRGHFDPDLYRDTYFAGEYGSPDQWQRLLFDPISDIELPSDVDPDVLLIRKALPLAGAGYWARFIAVLRLGDLLDEPEGERSLGVFAIVSRRGDVLWSSDRGATPLPPESLPSRDGTTVLTHAGSRVVVTVLASTCLGIRYVAVVDEALFWRSANAVARAAVLASLLSAVLCTLVVAVAMRSNYRPLRRLVSWIERREPEARDERGDEYARVVHSVERAYRRIERSESALDAQREVLRTALVVQILHGWAGEDAVARGRAMGILFPHPRYAVAAFALRHSLSAPAADVDLRPSVEEALGRLAHPGVTHCTAEVRGFLVCVLNAASDVGTEELGGAVDAARRAVVAGTGMECDVGVSGLHGSLPAVYRAWTEALEALEHGRRTGRAGVVAFSALARAERSGYAFALDAEVRLTEAVKRGSVEEALRIADGVFEGDGTQGSCGLTWVLALDVASAAIRSVAVQEDGSGEAVRSLAGAAERLRPDLGPQELRETVLGIVERAAGAASLRRAGESASRGISLAERVRSYLERHYGDPSLNPEAVAGALGAHPVGMARAFRGVAGVGISEYLTRLRVEQAKPLLREEVMSIDDVARAVGFTTKTMTRAFKRIEGLTPGRYREIARGA